MIDEDILIMRLKQLISNTYGHYEGENTYKLDPKRGRINPVQWGKRKAYQKVIVEVIKMSGKLDQKQRRKLS